MLAGTGLRNHAGLAHALGQQRLPQDVVDLVTARVVKVLTLEQHLPHTESAGQRWGRRQRGGTPGVVTQQGVEFGVEGLIEPGLAECIVEFVECGHQRFGHEAAAVLSEMPTGVGQTHCESLLVGVTDCGVLPCGHEVLNSGGRVGLCHECFAY